MDTTPLEPWVAATIGCDRDAPTRQAIHAYQLRQLRATLAWASTESPFYRKHLAAPATTDLNDLDDLARVPFTSAQDLRRDPSAFLCTSQDRISRVVTLQSSGTSGAPKRIYFTREDQEATIDFFHIGMSTFTNPGDRVLILLPAERPGGVGELLAIGLQRLGAVGIGHGPVADVEQTLAVMARERIDILVGIPTQVLALARCGKGRAAPRSVLLSTDYVPAAIVRQLERIWHCTVYTHYGMTETGYGGGVECRARCGYHMREADLYIEIVDPESGRPLPDGATGEVVVTTLRRRGMPLIRYRTGDVTRFLPQPCACRTVLKTMAPVKYRISGKIELLHGAWISLADLDEALFGVDRVLDFQARLTSQENRDCLEIEAVLTDEEGTGTVAAMHRRLLSNPSIRQALQRQRLTVSIKTGVGSGHLQPAAGKRKLIDERSSGVTR